MSEEIDRKVQEAVDKALEGLDERVSAVVTKALEKMAPKNKVGIVKQLAATKVLQEVSSLPPLGVMRASRSLLN